MGQAVILIGFMGSGKTTLGKKLASKLGIPFIDSDAEIEAKEDCTIAAIFSDKGEEYFRNLETQFLKDILNHHSHSHSVSHSVVLSTGGGMPCFNNNMDLLNQIGVTFYLERSPKELLNRLINAKEERPLVQNKTEEELLKYIEETIGQRETYYKQAKVILDRDQQTPEYILSLDLNS